MLKLKFLTALVCAAACVYGQQTISGVVEDTDNFPLTGVYVTVSPGGDGTVTGLDGEFSVNATSGDTLVFSFLGFSTQRIPVGNQTRIDVTMSENAQLIDEVVVVGYGVTKKRDLVSSVSQIKGDILENQPVSRLDQALQGRATGVAITSNNGAPGNGTTIRIRGTNSVNGNNNPLFVIDGFIAGSDFDLNTLNVNDIASIEVLKDATALAIYGTRGASGVVLVTTKTGAGLQTERPVVSVNQYYTSQHVTNQVELLTGEEYANYVNEAAQFVPGPDGFGATDPTLPLIFDDPASAPSTDWLGLVTQPGQIVNTDLSIRGNTGKTNYYVSMNRFDQDGVIKSSGFQRYSLRTNLDFSIGEKFTTGVRVNLSRTNRDNNKINYSDIVGHVLPTREVYDENGEYTAVNPVSASLQRNPVADQELRVDGRYDNDLLANAYLQVEPLEGLLLKTSLGAEISSYKRNFYLPGALPERLIDNRGGYASINTVQSNDLLNENTATYSFDVGNHGFNLLGGFSLQRNESEGFNASAERFPNDVVQFNNLSFGSDPATYQLSSGYSRRTFVSYFARLNYSFSSKYLISLTGRRDGSSVFEPGNKYAFFPSVGAAWNVHNEDFLSESNLVSRLKIRGSFGEVGEQGVPIYNSIARFNNVNAYFNETLVNGVLIGSLPSRNLTWETTRQFDLGFELGLWEDRVFVEADYYNKTTEDLLLNRDLPGTAGGSQLQNVGSIRNRGVELAVRSFNVSNRNFSWETQLSLSANRNEVLDLGGDEFINLRQPTNQGGAGIRLIPGQPAPVYVGAVYLGTYKDAETIAADGFEGRAFIGGPRYLDQDGNGVINDLDYVVIGNPQPDFYGGIRNTFQFNDLTLDVFFQGSYGNDGYNGVAQTGLFGRGDQTLLPAVVNRWREGVNEDSDIPRAGTSTSLFNPNNTLGIEDASFLRLKTVSLTYDLPVADMGIGSVVRDLKVYVTGNNLFLITNWSFGDPEVSNYGSGLEQGVSTGEYPYARSFTVGLNTSF
ncbi:TonB-linked SusC/RagA family outer membrane protein [Lewinella marina]|uniref:SusC/RagA family TonB-linked outer membrane protein n=1 Tax=Neolewinella marina TaxID=438751 RepID=A0A2G0CDD8_9BACT|nr:TonB-dependent receptor [Neolewinella marina]NJB86053.1 TonB-linked SusC/RagA family outer membrane protein [Neolewinella marina]PHK97982.1 SusC/RagA family TonB-linked outer membrane protein [Neolewinella marina]